MDIEATIRAEIIADLGANYRNDASVISVIIDDVINEALRLSNRYYLYDRDAQVEILKLPIKRCVKTLYLQRGIEDVSSNSQSGLSNSYIDAISQLESDIIKANKRILI